MNVPITALTRASQIYEKIDNPLAFIEQMGKSFQQSAIMGVNTPGDGAVLALTCMCEGITPLEFAKTYHIINGRPSMRADMMNAKFKAAGGKIRWINLGDDHKAAEAEFTYDGETLTIKYTIEDARAVVGDKLDKADSNWRKDRGAMLRARLITKAIRIMAPELIAGVYTPEELEDAGVAVSADPKPVKKSPAERRKELEAEAAAATPSVVVVDESPVKEAGTAVAADPVIEATIDPAPFESAPVDDSNEPVTVELLQEIAAVGSKIPSPTNPGQGMSIAEISEGICRACGVKKPQEAPRGKIRNLIARFKAEIAKSNAKG